MIEKKGNTYIFNVCRMRRSSFIFSQYTSPVYDDFAVTLICNIYITFINYNNLHIIHLDERGNKIFYKHVALILY